MFVCVHAKVIGQGDARPDGVYVGCSTQEPKCHSGLVMRHGAVWLEQWGGYRHTKDLMSCECTVSFAYIAGVSGSSTFLRVLQFVCCFRGWGCREGFITPPIV